MIELKKGGYRGYRYIVGRFVMRVRNDNLSGNYNIVVEITRKNYYRFDTQYIRRKAQ